MTVKIMMIPGFIAQSIGTSHSLGSGSITLVGIVNGRKRDQRGQSYRAGHDGDPPRTSHSETQGYEVEERENKSVGGGEGQTRIGRRQQQKTKKDQWTSLQLSRLSVHHSLLKSGEVIDASKV